MIAALKISHHLSRNKRCWFFLLLMHLCFGSDAQQINVQNKGSVVGSVWDSVHDYVLPSASVVVYDSNAVMLQYTLTDMNGGFQFRDLPLQQHLGLVVTYTGYKLVKKFFTLSAADSLRNLGRINLVRSNSGELDEVIVKAIVPVRMKGDTMEFNADAFKLDPNAVVEDLLLKLPGVTLWGDGTITVNGRKVQSVTVEGKPFFGGDPKIATQNIDKQAVDKIQVFKNEDLSGTGDSSVQVNIKLKAKGRVGNFGKLAAGGGSNHTYEGDLAFNRYSPQLQVALAGSLNNVNKYARDIFTLLRNSTYKGTGTNTDYLSNFGIPGENRTRTAGCFLQYDFIKGVDYLRKDLLQSNYFYSNNKNESATSTTDLFTFKPDSLLLNQGIRSKLNFEDRHSFSTKYDKKKEAYELSASIDISALKNESVSNGLNVMYNSNNDSTSSATMFNNMYATSRSVSLNTGFDNRMKHFWRRFKGLRISYTSDYRQNRYTGTEITSFTSFVKPSDNTFFNRSKIKDHDQWSNGLELTYDNLGSLLFGSHFSPGGVVMGFSGKARFETESESQSVKDRDSTSGHYVPNVYLTNQRRMQILEMIPSLDFSRRVDMSSVNRYRKNLLFRIRFPLNARNEYSHSDKNFQTYTKHYVNLLPNAGISYSNHQFGEFLQDVSLDLENSLGYPSINQLAPLIDSANVYFLQPGNPGLRPFRKKELSLSYKYSGERRKDDIGFSITVSAGNIRNNIVDSSLYNESGQRITYFVNTLSYTTFLSLRGDFSKSLKFSGHQLQFKLVTSNETSNTPNYFNNELNRSRVLNSRNTLSIHYDHKSLIAFKLAQSLFIQQVKQQVAYKKTLSSLTSISEASAAIHVNRRTALYSNLYFTYNKYGVSPPAHFNIWNAAVTYRFLPKLNAELKLSALDILKQNKSISNSVTGMSLTTTTSNVLQQYYMLTFSFYPRKTGGNKNSQNDTDKD